MMAMLRQGSGGGPQPDKPLPDTAEKIQISSLSLLKMLKHGRAGVPMEVMGLMLGQFVDDYTITCVDVFAMPQVRCIYTHLLACLTLLAWGHFSSMAQSLIFIFQFFFYFFFFKRIHPFYSHTAWYRGKCGSC